MSNTEREKIKNKVDRYVRYLYACDAPENTEQQVEQYNNAFMQLIDTYVEDQKREALKEPVALLKGLKDSLEDAEKRGRKYIRISHLYHDLNLELQSQKQGEPTNEPTI